VAQAGNILVGFEAGIDQVFSQRTNDAVAPGEDLADRLRIAQLCAARRLDDATGGGIDHRRDAARLGVESVDWLVRRHQRVTSAPQRQRF
jgi:hypothetical protein